MYREKADNSERKTRIIPSAIVKEIVTQLGMSQTMVRMRERSQFGVGETKGSGPGKSTSEQKREVGVYRIRLGLERGKGSRPRQLSRGYGGPGLGEDTRTDKEMLGKKEKKIVFRKEV